MHKRTVHSAEEWFRWTLDHSEEFAQKESRYFKMAIICILFLAVSSISSAWWKPASHLVVALLEVTLAALTAVSVEIWLIYRFKRQRANEMVNFHVDNLLEVERWTQIRK
jgi:Na+-driven multidrug efflux pump